MDLNFASFWLENHSFQAMNRFGSNEKENHDILVQKAFPITFTSINKLSVLWFVSPVGSETMLVDGKGSVLRFEILMNFNTQGHTGGLHLHHFTSQSVRKVASRPADQLLLRKECPIMISKVSLATSEGEELFCCGDAIYDVTYIQKILEGAKK